MVFKIICCRDTWGLGNELRDIEDVMPIVTPEPIVGGGNAAKSGSLFSCKNIHQYQISVKFKT